MHGPLQTLRQQTHGQQTRGQQMRRHELDAREPGAAHRGRRLHTAQLGRDLLPHDLGGVAGLERPVGEAERERRGDQGGRRLVRDARCRSLSGVRAGRALADHRVWGRDYRGCDNGAD